MKFKPHDHRIWAVIGIYGGREQNIFYQRAEHGLKQHGTKELHPKDAVPLGAAIIHAVTNPLDQITAAIHVYGDAAEFYQRYSRLMLEPWVPALVKAVCLESGERILDVACGTGFVARHAAECVGEVGRLSLRFVAT